MKLTFVVVITKYFWSGCFAPPCLLRPGATAPSLPPQLRHCLEDKRIKADLIEVHNMTDGLSTVSFNTFFLTL